MASIRTWKDEIDEVVILANDIEDNCNMKFTTKSDVFSMMTTARGLEVALPLVADCMIEMLERLINQVSNYEATLVADTINGLRSVETDELLKHEIYLASINFGDEFLNMINDY